MTTMLVSFPLSFPANFSLATLDYDSGAVAWVDLQGVGEDVKGINGMVAHRGHYWCLAETDTGDKLIAFDAALNLVYKQDLAKSRSTHTIIPHRDGFLVANTGYNGVTYLELTPVGVKEDVIWRFVENDKDQVHVNSVAELGGKVFVSMFGYRAEGIVQGGWSSATNGQVVNITDNTVIAEGLLSPHTLVVHEGALYWLESRRG